VHESRTEGDSKPELPPCALCIPDLRCRMVTEWRFIPRHQKASLEGTMRLELSTSEFNRIRLLVYVLRHCVLAMRDTFYRRVQTGVDKKPRNDTQSSRGHLKDLWKCTREINAHQTTLSKPFGFPMIRKTSWHPALAKQTSFWLYLRSMTISGAPHLNRQFPVYNFSCTACASCSIRTNTYSHISLSCTNRML
jgi:hypothetical protein